MTEQVSSKNTKAQILDAYSRLYKEHERLQAEHSKAVKAQGTLETRLAELTGAQKRVATQVSATEPGRNIDAILAGLAGLRASIGDAIGELSNELTAEIAKLQELRSQTEDKSSQLTRLYGLTITDGTLDELIEEYREKAQAFELQARQWHEAFEQEKAHKLESWKQEQKEHARASKEREEALKRERQRSLEEYRYTLEMQRRLDEEQYQHDQKRRHSQWAEQVNAKEQEWAEREQEIAEQEREYEELRAGVESFPAERAAAVKDAEKEGTDLARRQARTRDELLAKEDESNRRVAELKVRALQETVQAQAQRIASLSAQLDMVVKQSQDLAVKAIEGASHETSLQSIREIALEQAKRQPKGQ